MGRHRRSAAGRRAAEAAQPEGSGARPHDPRAFAGDGPTLGTAPYLNPEAYAEERARSDAYLYGTQGTADDGSRQPAGATVAFPQDGFRPEGDRAEDGPERPGTRRRRKKAGGAPVRTGLLGASAAVALGAVAVATGVVPGLDGLRIGGGPGGSDKVQAADSPANTPGGQGGTSGTVGSGGEDAAAGAGRSASPSSPAASASGKPSAPASPTPDEKTPSQEKKEEKKAEKAAEAPAASDAGETGSTPSRSATQEAQQQTESPSGGSAAVSREAAAEAEVLRLVNVERAKVGCTPVAADSALSGLAESFSEAMAAEDFFDHTDPSGRTPWDRAEAAGISGLGGENIARGQADAAAVMDAWMNSEGHRANILNCDFTSLGVGVHFGSGGPWWTQDFGY
ncbi:CAP domain-containing protein [Streptomyces sp. CRN 30]|uniref:CAP domain-containing protein n=1 Tax=Streptomyces sp. CRN 30 TaxID=3075613 RepID=UPI002A7F8AE9|nr:CAP domain-containing protein [Streptomyces sp. CRN 30]